MRRKLACVVLGVGLLVAAWPVIAHHSFAAEFDSAQPITLSGTVTKMEWINPHAWIHVAVKKADGTVENWEIETGNPSALIRRGFNRNSLPAGTEITVQGFRAKDGGLRANGRDLTFKDGKKLFVGSSGTGAPDERPEK
jgi:hypothetical protein